MRDPSVQCVVCTDNYDNPKALNCEHAFCSGCCSRMTENGAIICPVCFKRTIIPPEGLPTDHTKMGKLQSIFTMMMSKNDSSFRCRICTDYYENPKQLTCGHSFCCSCCFKMSKEEAVVCPLCRESTKIPPAGLTTNYALRDAVVKHLEDEFSIKIVQLTGDSFTLKGVHTSDEVCCLKQKVAVWLGIPSLSLHLVYSGKSLADDKTMKEYDIKSGATVHVLFRSRGGNAQ